MSEGLEGQIVMLRICDSTATDINRRRSALGAGCCNQAAEGDLLPMLVVKDWGDGCVNGQVFADGDFTVWATSVVRGDQPGQWQER